MVLAFEKGSCFYANLLPGHSVLVLQTSHFIYIDALEDIRIGVNLRRWQNNLCFQCCKDLSCCWPKVGSFWKAVFPYSISGSCRCGCCTNCVWPLPPYSSLAESTCGPSWSSHSPRALLETPQSLSASRWTVWIGIQNLLPLLCALECEKPWNSSCIILPPSSSAVCVNCISCCAAGSVLSFLLC